MQGVYGDFLHRNNGTYLDEGVLEDAIWQRRWRRMAAKSASWYVKPYGAVGDRFIEILATERQGVFKMIWNFERPLVFAHIFLKNTLSIRRFREIIPKITSRMDLWIEVSKWAWRGKRRRRVMLGGSGPQK